VPRPRERRWPLLVAGYAVFLALVAAGSAPVYFVVEAPNRPLVTRLAAGLIVAVVVVHLLKRLRARIDVQVPSAFERALDPDRPQPSHDPRFVQIREELRYSASSGVYFDRVLWPQLTALADQAPRRPSRERLVKPAGRFFRRGPSLTTLRDLMRTIEEARE